MKRLLTVLLILSVVTLNACSGVGTGDQTDGIDSKSELSVGDTISNDNFELTLNYVESGDYLYNINAVDSSVPSEKFTKYINEYLKPLDMDSVSENEKSILKTGSYFIDDRYQDFYGGEWTASSSLWSSDEKKYIAVGYTIKYIGKEESQSFSSSSLRNDMIEYKDGYTFENSLHCIRNVAADGRNWENYISFKSLSEDKYECREYFYVPNEVVESESESMSLVIKNYGFDSVNFKIR